MSGLVTHSTHGSVAQLTFHNGPDNALSAPLCGALIQALQMALATAKTQAIVITAKGKSFSAGLDLTWLDQSPTPSELLHLCDLIENAQKPIIMALQGDAIGAGFELALCGHYRIAAPNIRVGLPGITLDLPPVAGATQRLPRLIGAEATLHMLLSGGTITASALGPVFDAELAGNFNEGAIAFAIELVVQDAAPVPSGKRNGGLSDPFAYQAAIRDTKTLAAQKGQVGLDILSAVEAAALLPFTAGLELEQDSFTQHSTAPRARALRHILSAESQLAHKAQALITTEEPLDHLAIVGVTPTGISLAARCLLDGLSVTYVATQSESEADITDRLLPYLVDGLKAAGADPQTAPSYLDQLEIDAELEACGGTDLVIEASPNKPEQKLRVFEDLGYILPAHTVLAATSRTVPLEDYAEASGRPQNVIGLDVPVPAHTTAVLELIHGPDTGPFAISLAAQLAQVLGKSLIQMGNTSADTSAPLLLAMWEMTDHLLRQGASISQIDQAMMALGFAQGPCLALDLRGIRAALLQAKHFHHGVTADLPVLSALSAEGLLGQRAGEGFYTHSGRDPQPSQKAEALIKELQSENAQAPSDQDITAKIMAAMANAGARLLGQATGATPADIDVLMVNGYGVPRDLGGPMQYADATGLLATKNHLSGAGKALQPDPVLLDLIKNGQTFADLNR